MNLQNSGPCYVVALLLFLLLSSQVVQAQETNPQETNQKTSPESSQHPPVDAISLQRPLLKMAGRDNPLPQVFDDIWREVKRLEITGKKPLARKLADRMEHLVAQANDDILPLPEDQAELHMIGLYEGEYRDGKGHGGGRHPQGEADIHITFTKQPLVLAITSYEPVKWKLKVAEGVVLKKVFLAGYYDQEIEGLPDGVELVDTSGKNRLNEGPRFFVYTKERLAEFAHAAVSLLQATDLRIATFQGMYGYKGKPFVIGEENIDWRNQLLLHRLKPLHDEAMTFQREQRRAEMQVIQFRAVHFLTEKTEQGRHGGKDVLADFTLSGPIAGTLRPVPEGLNHAVQDPKTSHWYGIRSSHLMMVNADSGAKTELETPNDLPRLSHPCGLTLDTKRRRLILASLGGKGYMYGYNLDTEDWVGLGELNNVDAGCVAYSAEEDVIYAVQFDYRGQGKLYTYSAAGALIGEVKLQLQQPRHDGFPQANYRQIRAVGKQVVYLTLPSPDLDDPEYRDFAKAYLFNPENGEVVYQDRIQLHAGRADLTDAEIGDLWKTLLVDDDAKAELAVWKLAAGGKDAVDFISNKLEPLPKPDTKLIAELIVKLDAADYRDREAAHRKLAELGEVAGGQLAEAVKKPVSIEQSARLRRLLLGIAHAAPESPEIRREYRAIRALGRARIPVARDYLEQLRQEAPGTKRSSLAEEAIGWPK